MVSAREEALLYGVVDWFGLERMHWWVAREFPEAPLPELQDKTLELVRSLVADGLLEIGELKSETGRFVAWDMPIDEALERIRAPYLTRFDDWSAWAFICWLNVTDKGIREAEAIEA